MDHAITAGLWYLPKDWPAILAKVSPSVRRGIAESDVTTSPPGLAIYNGLLIAAIHDGRLQAWDLVFHVINDGRFRAVTADKGEILYEIQTGRTGEGEQLAHLPRRHTRLQHI